MKRGDIYSIDIEPTAERPERLVRYVLVISADAFNKSLKLPVILPISASNDRVNGFSVNIPNSLCGGFVQCDMPRTIDIKARRGGYIENLPEDIVDDILARVSTIFS